MVPFIRLGAPLSFNYTHCCSLLNMLETHCQPTCTMHHCCRRAIEVPLLVELTHVFSRERVKHCFQITFHGRLSFQLGISRLLDYGCYYFNFLSSCHIIRKRHTWIHLWHLDIKIRVKWEIMGIFECFFLNHHCWNHLHFLFFQMYSFSLTLI